MLDDVRDDADTAAHALQVLKTQNKRAMAAQGLGEMGTSTAGSFLTRLSHLGRQAPAMVIPPGFLEGDSGL